MWLWLSIKRGIVCSNFIADIMVVLQELYMSSMVVSSTCSIDSSWVGADGCWSRECSNCCVLASCLLKAFQWHSRWPRETCDVMIQEWFVRYACRTGWKMTDSPNSFPDVFVVGLAWTVCVQKWCRLSETASWMVSWWSLWGLLPLCGWLSTGPSV